MKILDFSQAENHPYFVSLKFYGKRALDMLYKNHIVWLKNKTSILDMYLIQ